MTLSNAVAASLAALLLLATVSVPVLAGNKDNKEDNRRSNDRDEKDTVVHDIRLSGLATGTQVVLEVLLVEITDDFIRTNGFDPAQGVLRRNVDRLDLGQLPLVGDLFAPGYSRADFDPNNRVGSAYLDGETLLVVRYSPPWVKAVDDLVVVNTKYANTVQSGSDPGEGEIDVLLPEFTSRMAATGIALQDGQSFVLAGLLQAAQDNESQVPWLGEVPILSDLFAGEAYEVADDEIVILVTPTIFDRRD